MQAEVVAAQGEKKIQAKAVLPAHSAQRWSSRATRVPLRTCRREKTSALPPLTGPAGFVIRLIGPGSRRRPWPFDPARLFRTLWPEVGVKMQMPRAVRLGKSK